MPDIAGFWSYAHTDEEGDGGILKLAENLRKEYRLLTGEELELFVDTDDLFWGDDWRERIAEALERITFFIPVITPTYFLRPECRRELLRFTREAKDRGAEQLVLPIYYITVSELEQVEEPGDEAMAIIKPKHREDLRDLRLEDPTGPEYRKLVNRLAVRLIDIASSSETGSSSSNISSSGRTTSEPLDDPSETEDPEDEDGYIEIMAKGELAMGEVGEVIEEMNADMNRITESMKSSTVQMNADPDPGKPHFARMLTIANSLASDITEPAEAMESHSQKYISLLLDVDQMVNATLDNYESEPKLLEEDDAESYIRSLRELIASSQSMSAGLESLVAITEDTTKFSRELRKPLRQFQVSLRNVIDAQPTFNSWEERLNQLDG